MGWGKKIATKAGETALGVFEVDKAHSEAYELQASPTGNYTMLAICGACGNRGYVPKPKARQSKDVPISCPPCGETTVFKSKK